MPKIDFREDLRQALCDADDARERVGEGIELLARLAEGADPVLAEDAEEAQKAYVALCAIVRSLDNHFAWRAVWGVGQVIKMQQGDAQ